MKFGHLGIVEDILRKSTDLLRRVVAPVGGRGRVTLSCVCPHCNSFPLEDYIWWVLTEHGDGNSRKKRHRSWWCAVCGGKYEWRAPNRILVVQLATNENLINALKLLANQQRDGGLREKGRERITNGLRSFIAQDNHCAVEVGHLRKGQRPFRVKKPKIGEYHSEALREGADDLTSRAEAVDTLKACINVDHIAKDFWDRHWSTQTGTPFAKQFMKELIGGSEWEELYYHFREMSKAKSRMKVKEQKPKGQ